MRHRNGTSALLLRLALAGPAPAFAHPADTTSVHYLLASPPSVLEIGCQGPCACPVWHMPLHGSFTLRPAGYDPLYSYYDLVDIDWRADSASTLLPITGSGRYQIGGEFAIMHRLTLDLVIAGRPPQHFDSGLNPGGGEFPTIRIESAAHGFACYDTVVRLDAKPATALVDGGGGARIRAPHPNPFRGSTEIEFVLPASGPTDLEVLDVAGRRIQTLVGPAWMSPGRHVRVWDGSAEDERPAAAGVYLVRLRTPAGATWSRVVKLR